MYQRPVNAHAKASLTLGIVGLVVGWCILCIPSLLAVIFGHLALREIAKTGQDGARQAKAGLIMGYIPLILLGIGVVMLLATKS